MNSYRSVKKLATRFFALPSRERQLLIQALLLLWVIRVGLWTFSFQTISDVMEGRSSSFVPVDHSEERIIWAVRVASKFVPSATCLAQALAARALLKAHGYGANLIIGVAKDGERLKAHAWLEKDDRVIIGGSTSDFKPLSIEDDRS
ncbi:MAG: lasso peptide biosynthesis B2 protein [Methanothrix sp.]